MKPDDSKASVESDLSDLSSSWCRTLSRTAHSRISSADHVIVLEAKETGPTTGSRPASFVRFGAAPAAEQARAAAAAGAATSADAAGGDDSLTMPLLSTAADDEPDATAGVTAAAAAAGDDGDPCWQDEEWAARFPATAAARAAAEAARGLKTARSPGPQLQAAAAAAAGTATQSAEASLRRSLDAAYALSWAVNILLLAAKLYAYGVSQSKAVLASAADSAVDLVSQVVIAYADWKMRTEDPRFPVGQARLEAIGVLACACIMSVASFQVISSSISELYETLTTGVEPDLQLGLVMYVVLGSATALKLLCYVVCAALQSRSDSMLALAEDHLNDILSNLAAIVTAVIAGATTGGWWVDPAGAILISLYIVWRWLDIAKQQVDKVVGRGAPADFVRQLESLANSHHSQLGLDVLRAYHFGSRYIVEMEVVLPAAMSVRDSHDISLDLQHKVEQLEQVERAFVHVDYERRDGLEHKVERELAIARAASLGASSGTGSTGGGRASASGGGVSHNSSQGGANGGLNGPGVQPLLPQVGDDAC